MNNYYKFSETYLETFDQFLLLVSLLLNDVLISIFNFKVLLSGKNVNLSLDPYSSSLVFLDFGKSPMLP
jgi:hypothetical protein